VKSITGRWVECVSSLAEVVHARRERSSPRKEGVYITSIVKSDKNALTVSCSALASTQAVGSRE